LSDTKKKFVKKSVRKSLKITVEENEILLNQLKKHNLTFSDFARSKILNQKIKSKLTNNLIYEIAKIGNNLNQIAKYVNTKKALDFQILEKLVHIEKKLEKIRNDY
jgi:beta-lactamase class D